eukprot:1831371-Pyramimonas_sp.AAC.1
MVDGGADGDHCWSGRVLAARRAGPLGPTPRASPRAWFDPARGCSVRPLRREARPRRLVSRQAPSWR